MYEIKRNWCQKEAIVQLPSVSSPVEVDKEELEVENGNADNLPIDELLFETTDFNSEFSIIEDKLFRFLMLKYSGSMSGIYSLCRVSTPSYWKKIWHRILLTFSQVKDLT